MVLIKYIVSVLLAVTVAATWSTAAAQKNKTKKDQGAHDPFVMEKTAGKVYVFGVSQRLGGDEVFITEISEVDSLAIQKKTKFLPFRSAMSLQLQSYVEGVLEEGNQTVAVFFSEKKETLKKKLAKVRKRYLAHNDKEVTTVILDEFRFKHPLDMRYKESKEETQQQNEEQVSQNEVKK